MNKCKIAFTIFFLGFSFQIKAKCLKDIFSFGGSIDSLVYEATKSNDKNISIATKSGFGIKAGWIILCPSSKTEYIPYFRVRFFNFDKDSISSTSPITGSNTLPSLGIEFKKSFSKKLDIPIDIELRREIGLKENYSNNTLSDIKYNNLKVVSGGRYFIWSKDNDSIMTMAKVGVLAPFGGEGNKSLGTILGLSGEYFRKLSRKLSLRTDLYFDYHQQKIDNLKVKRKELGLRANFVFRL